MPSHSLEIDQLNTDTWGRCRPEYQLRFGQVSIWTNSGCLRYKSSFSSAKQVPKRYYERLKGVSPSCLWEAAK